MKKNDYELEDHVGKKALSLNLSPKPIPTKKSFLQVFPFAYLKTF
jgi:hypothetical protein